MGDDMLDQDEINELLAGADDEDEMSNSEFVKEFGRKQLTWKRKLVYFKQLIEKYLIPGYTTKKGHIKDQVDGYIKGIVEEALKEYTERIDKYMDARLKLACPSCYSFNVRGVEKLSEEFRCGGPPMASYTEYYKCNRCGILFKPTE